MPVRVLSATIQEQVMAKLDKLAKETRRKKSYFVNKALEEMFEEMDDYHIALTRKGGTGVSLAKAKKILF